MQWNSIQCSNFKSLYCGLYYVLGCENLGSQQIMTENKAGKLAFGNFSGIGVEVVFKGRMNANNAARGVGGLLRFLGGHVGLGWCWLKGQCLDLFRLVYRIKQSLFGIFSGLGLGWEIGERGGIDWKGNMEH